LPVKSSVSKSILFPPFLPRLPKFHRSPFPKLPGIVFPAAPPHSANPGVFCTPPFLPSCFFPPNLRAVPPLIRVYFCVTAPLFSLFLLLASHVSLPGLTSVFFRLLFFSRGGLFVGQALPPIDVNERHFLLPTGRPHFYFFPPSKHNFLRGVVPITPKTKYVLPSLRGPG